MIDYIKGEIAEISPAHVTLDCENIGYFINISLNTYTALADKKSCKIYIHEAIREDAYVLYGFLDKSERQLFLHLISVSGVGANTARMILSSLSVAELEDVIVSGNVGFLKSVKGIGGKTAERIIVDLRDKVGRTSEIDSLTSKRDSSTKTEAVSALMMLGFQQSAANKVVTKLVNENPTLAVELIIKQALKML
ncbi:MAG: Holliday junction branch migration protein RuvA [Prevotellaceae bacterium]|jgi:Holliday junction DNA helicase RuvA|nr:Holliday junction branch migration protein RuvA [Prevotellaceae bacterium]